MTLKPLDIVSVGVGIAGLMFGLWQWYSDPVPATVEDMRAELQRLSNAVLQADGFGEDSREPVLNLIETSQALTQSLERQAIDNGIRNVPVTRLAVDGVTIKRTESEVFVLPDGMRLVVGLSYIDYNGARIVVGGEKHEAVTAGARLPIPDFPACSVYVLKTNSTAKSIEVETYCNRGQT